MSLFRNNGYMKFAAIVAAAVAICTFTDIPCREIWTIGIGLLAGVAIFMVLSGRAPGHRHDGEPGSGTDDGGG